MVTRRMIRLGMVVLLALVASAPAGAGSAGSPSGSTSADRHVAVTWRTTRQTLDDGRAYFVRAPRCSPGGSAGCADVLGERRAVVFFLHGAGALEDREGATSWLTGLNAIGRDTIFVFGISKKGTDRRWDAGICCTTESVDDVDYLERVVADIDRTWPVARGRVGALGLSNGGMLALRAACQRPKLFGTVAGLAATYDRSCDRGRVRIAQWHGADDTTVPLNGGTVTIFGEERELPPVASLAQRMARGSTYQLRVIPDREHSMTWHDFKVATRWVLDNLG